MAAEEGTAIQTVLTAAPSGFVSDGNIYGLKKDDAVFAKVESGTEIAAHTAYLRLADSEVKSIRIVLGDDTTGIDAIENSVLSGNAVYNINGQRMSVLRKGINIVNGKKVIIK